MIWFCCWIMWLYIYYVVWQYSMRYAILLIRRNSSSVDGHMLLLSLLRNQKPQKAKKGFQDIKGELWWSLSWTSISLFLFMLKLYFQLPRHLLSCIMIHPGILVYQLFRDACITEYLPFSDYFSHAVRIKIVCLLYCIVFFLLFFVFFSN